MDAFEVIRFSTERGEILALQTLTLSEIEANPELYLTFWRRRRESQGLAGRKTGRSVCLEWRTKRSAHYVVDSREIGPICHVKALGRKGKARCSLILNTRAKRTSNDR